MNVDEGYRILRISKGAGLEEIKKAYRTLAFQFHPDLNHDDPHAGRMFQRINEAYVLLKDHLSAHPEAGAAAGQKDAGPSPGASPPPPPPPPPPGPEQFRQQHPQGKPSSQRKHGARKANPEEILRDILKDPFARQVFEDIYNQIRQSGGKAPLKVQMPPKRRRLHFEWGDKRFNLDLTGGLWKGLKLWMRSWMDEDRTLHLPSTVLLPGSRVRLQVQQGWSGKTIAVDVSVPPDYVPGRPLRLKGLGRKFGPWTGDLLVRLLVR